MKDRKYSKRGISIIVVIVLFLVGIIAFRTRTLKAELNSKEQELARIESGVTKAREETSDIQNEIIYRQTDEYIEDQARANLGLRYADEIIVVPGE
ncbi:MAG: septum formation initiator family protein [Lachnospiraceae bacterium]|nr:septum formation initiator family protein [Lachnospiraceae bacterium]